MKVGCSKMVNSQWLTTKVSELTVHPNSFRTLVSDAGTANLKSQIVNFRFPRLSATRI